MEDLYSGRIIFYHFLLVIFMTLAIRLRDKAYLIFMNEAVPPMLQTSRHAFDI